MEIASLVPDSDVFTSFADSTSQAALGARLRTWPLQRPFGATRRYRMFLPLYPLWFGRLDLRKYDLVVSSSSAFAHAGRTRSDARHVAYIHSPMRYAYDFDTYVAGSSLSLPSRVVARTITGPLRSWSRRTAQRPDVLVANSRAVQERIRAHWKRDADVIHPPVDASSISLSTQDDGFLLVAARLLAYRRVDLAIDACTSLGRRLIVVGDGPERRKLENRAGAGVQFLGSVDRPTLVDLFERCHAYLVPGVEDFGIAPVEAMAAGKPVAAFAAGGALDTVVDGVNGVLFEQQTSASLAEAIERLDATKVDPVAIRAHAERFAPANFRAKFVELFQRLGVDPSLYYS
jgi:glycosyltransferase involved in cell wall biosynthesis